MKKKIVLIVLVIVSFAVVVISSFFAIFSSLREYESQQNNLKNYLNIIETEGINNNINNLNIKIEEEKIICTYMNYDGDIIYENTNFSKTNQGNKEEIKDAKSKKEAFAVRYSKRNHKKYIYYAKIMDDNNILRVAVPYKETSIINSQNICIYILLILLVIAGSTGISMRIIHSVVEPLNQLEAAAKRISNGDLNIRVNIKSKDEIGILSENYNNMADQLESKINEVIDKQNRLESIISSMQSGVIAVTEDNKIITINPYAKVIFGIKQVQVGDELSSYINDKDIYNFLNDEEELQREMKISMPMERELKIKKTFLHGANGIGKVIAITDISDIRRLENIRSQFVANVTHELKTPLTSIKGFTETLKYVDDSETREKFLDIIDKETERLTRLINDILVLSKLESSVMGDMEEFQPGPVIEEVKHMVESEANKKDISVNIHNDYIENITLNRDKFLQLVLNLVENAVKYSEENASITINSYKNNNKYVLEVEDTGIGIPEEDIPRIFERFYRVDKSRKGSSTGLGLAIVKHIVKSYNGNIFVESKLAKGTKFTVEFNI